MAAVLTVSLKLLISLLLTVNYFPTSTTESESSYLEVYPPDDELSGKTKSIFFGLILSFPKSQFDSFGAAAGVRVALDRINSDPYLLQNYTLRYTLSDSKCNRTIALDSLFNQMISSPTKHAVVGAGCSVASEPTAEVSHYYNITQISCVTASTELKDRVRFPRYFQLHPAEETMALAYFAVIKEYGWKRVSLIVQKERLFTLTVEYLKKLLDKDGVSYSEKEFDTRDGIAGIGNETFDLNSRIHIIRTYTGPANQLLCEAHSKGLLSPKHLFFTPAWYPNRWWTAKGPCKVEDREKVLNRSLAFIHSDSLTDPNRQTTTGITGAQFDAEEEIHLNKPPFHFKKHKYSQHCYDATWTLAYALNDTLNDIDPDLIPGLNDHLAESYLNSSSDTFHLEQFTYKSDALLDVIFKHVKNTSFMGISGPVFFDENGIRVLSRPTVYQFRYHDANNDEMSLDWIEVGHVLKMDNQMNYTFQYVSGETSDTVWLGGLVPYDGVPIAETVSVSVALTVIFSSLASAGIIFALFCITFNLIFREKKLVRLTSPNLNLLIGVGAIILYIDVYCTVVPSANPDVVVVFCNLTPWLTAIGYSLCYGTMVVKMCRVYFIFSNPSTRKKMVFKDWMLALGVVVLVVVDLIILITYTAVEGARGNLSAQRVPNRENPDDVVGVLDTIMEFFIYVCDSRARSITLGVLYGYKALLQILAILFAFSIRKVKIKGLGDSKYIAAAIYVTSIVTAVIIVSNFTLTDFINVHATVLSLGFLTGTTVILALVFLPVLQLRRASMEVNLFSVACTMMFGLYKDPDGSTIFEKSEGQGSIPASNFQTQTIDSLKQRVKKLEDIITELQGSEDVQTCSTTANHRDKPRELQLAGASKLSTPCETPNPTNYEKSIELVEQMAEGRGEAVTSPGQKSLTIWDGHATDVNVIMENCETKS